MAKQSRFTLKMLKRDWRRTKRRTTLGSCKEGAIVTCTPNGIIAPGAMEGVMEKKRRITQELNDTYQVVLQELNGVLD